MLVVSEPDRKYNQALKVPVKYSVFITLVSFLGWTLAFMDSQFFGLLVPKIIPALRLTLNDISLITLVSNLFAILSGYLLGELMDRRGRLLPFQITMAIYSIGSFLTAVSNGFLSLIGARTVVTMGTSPEGAVASVMVAENSDKRWRGISTGLLLLGVPVGVTIASLLVKAVVVDAGLSWRYVFLIGVFPALLIVFARLKAKESKRYEGMDKARKAVATAAINGEKTTSNVDLTKAKKDPFKQIFASDLRRKSIAVIIFTMLASGVFSSILLFGTEYMTVAKGISYGASLTVVGTGSTVSIFGYIVATFIGQKVGRKETTILFALLGAVALYFLYQASGFEHVLISYSLFQFFFASIGSTFVALFVEMYPTRARGAGQSLNFISQSLGYAIWPLILSLTVGILGWNQAFLATEVVPLIISALSLLAIPHVRPTDELEAIAI
jgi:MFS family permease